jgi:fructose-1,6-bisphosphatase/inositol monophosphatase family enzyme
MDRFSEEVAALMHEVAALEIMPRFRALARHEVEEKEKDDYVTIADRASELWLTPRLLKLLPGSRVLGEEAASADPALLSLLESDLPVWTVDPVDGTKNFVDGLDTFGVMLSLIEKGAVTRAWIYLPVADELAVAARGEGTFLHTSGHAQRLDAGLAPVEPAAQGASFYVRFMPDDWRAAITTHAEAMGRRSSFLCSAVDYTNVAKGSHDFVTYHRMLPWDHAPGSLILREAGGVVRDMATGEDYAPRTLKGPHLVARDEASWQRTVERISALRNAQPS